MEYLTLGGSSSCRSPDGQRLWARIRGGKEQSHNRVEDNNDPDVVTSNVYRFPVFMPGPHIPRHLGM